MYARRRRLKILLDLGLRWRTPMQARVRLDKRDVLPLLGRHINATKGRPKHVPAWIGFAGKPSFDPSERLPETLHRHVVLSRVRGLFKLVQEFVKLEAFQLETDQWAIHRSIAERFGEAGQRIAVREEHVALSFG